MDSVVILPEFKRTAIPMDGNLTMFMIVITLFAMLIYKENLLELKRIINSMAKEMNELLTDMKKYTDK